MLVVLQCLYVRALSHAACFISSVSLKFHNEFERQEIHTVGEDHNQDMNSAMFDPLVHIPYAEGFDKCVQQALSLNKGIPVINL